MRNAKHTSILIGGVDYSRYLRLPLTIQRTLNEQLDSAVVELHNTRKSKPFAPFLPVSLGGETYILAEDVVTEVVGRNLYKHSLTLIEKTKEAERIICGAKAFTTPLVRDYTDGATKPRVTRFENATPVASVKPTWRLVQKAKLLPMKSSSLVTTPVVVSDAHVVGIPALDDMLLDGEDKIFEGQYSARIYVYYNPNGTAINLSKAVQFIETIGYFTIENGTIEMTPDGVSWDFTTRGVISPIHGAGVYTVRYDVLNSSGVVRYALVYDVAVVDNPVTKTPATIEEVIKRLLETCETLRVVLDQPRYVLKYTEEQAHLFKQTAPEFHFANGRSLWENLREVGQYIHAIPRITGNKVTFDELGGIERADLSKGHRVAKSTALNISDYTAALDTLANNLVNQDNLDDGSVTEPFDNGYKTMRTTAETARIQEETGVILTSYPVEKIVRLELAPFTYDGNDYPATDLTPYVFEKQEYDILSSYSGFFPSSKTFALYYTQGGRNIEGLWYKAQDSGSEIINSFKDYSITNIIEVAANVATGYFKTLPYTDLAFRVTYVPSVTARVRHYKPDYDGVFPSAMAYNQSANKLSAKAYGENLRGQLAMMGNTADTVTYMFKRMEDIPKAGTLYDDERYITSITARIYNDFVLAQMTLAEGYNELGAFVEVNNAIRQFEIPDSEDRYTVLEEFCLVSEAKSGDDSNTAATQALKDSIIAGLGYQASAKDTSLAMAYTRGYSNELLTSPSVALPVVSLAIGTSLYFGFRFEDNFSAGAKAASVGDVTDIMGRRYKMTEHVPYGDEFYAEAKTIAFTLVSGNSALNADALPASSSSSYNGTAMVHVGADYPILWHKDSADAGCISYQLHMVAYSGLILGDGLTYWCEAVRKQTSSNPAYIYFYPHRINQLTGTTDTESAVFTRQVYADEYNDRLYYAGTPDMAFESWAIIKDGKFVLGKNSTEIPGNIYFSLKRRLT